MKNVLDNLKSFFSAPSYSRTLALVGVLILVVALPVTVIFLGQLTNTKQGASLVCGDNGSNTNYNGCGQQGGCSNGFPANDWVSYDYDGHNQCKIINCQSHGYVAGHCGYTAPTCQDHGGICIYGGCPNGNLPAGGDCGSQYMQCCNRPAPTKAPLPTPNQSACNTAAQKYTQVRNGNVNYHPYKSAGCEALGQCRADIADGSGAIFDVNGNACGNNSGTVCCATFGPPPTTTTCSQQTYTDGVTKGFCTSEASYCADTYKDINDCTGKQQSCCFRPANEFTCDRNLGVTPNNGFKNTISGQHSFCASNEYCDNAKKDAWPCVKMDVQDCPLTFIAGSTGGSLFGFNNCSANTVRNKEPNCKDVNSYVLRTVNTNSDVDTFYCDYHPTSSSTKTCSDIIPGGICTATSGPVCPSGYHDSNADHPNVTCSNGTHGCCIPDAPNGDCDGGNGACTNLNFAKGGSCEGEYGASSQKMIYNQGPAECNKYNLSGVVCCSTRKGTGSGGGCTNGQQTQFTLNIKLPGIGEGTFENHTPATPIKHGSLVVKDGNGNIKNGQSHDFSHAFSHTNGNGKLASEHVDLGKTTLVCGQTYHVEVKIPGYVTIKKDVVYGQDQTIDITENDVIPGDIVSEGTDNSIVNGKVIGDDKVTIADYNVFKACHENPSQVFTFTSNAQTVNLNCGDLINLFDFQDGGAGTDANGISEFADNYNLWLRGYIKANGY